MTSDFGKLLIIVGGLIVVVGLFLTMNWHIPWLGKLPGDIYIKRGNFRFYFPLATSLLFSILVTLVLYLLRK